MERRKSCCGETDQERNRRYDHDCFCFSVFSSRDFSAKSADNGSFRRLSVPPKAIVVEVTPVEKTREEKLWDQINKNKDIRQIFWMP